jgi:hypothetical protein
MKKVFIGMAVLLGVSLLFSGCDVFKMLGFGEDEPDEPDNGGDGKEEFTWTAAASFFRNAAESWDSAIDVIGAAKQAVRSSVAVVLSPGTEMVSFIEDADIGTTGLVLTAADSPAIVVIDGGNRAITLTSSGTDPVITVGTGVTLTLRNITLTGNTDNNAPLIKVNGGRLVLEDGARITGNTSNRDGGGVLVYGGSFEMSGGTIFDNTSDYGGGVLVTGGSFKMSGGTISDNTSVHGGGVYVYGSASFEMSGNAVVSGNVAGSSGGGVMLVGDGRFNMTGGVIYGSGSEMANIASVGAAVYVENGGVSDVNTTDDTVINGKIQSDRSTH